MPASRLCCGNTIKAAIGPWRLKGATDCTGYTGSASPGLVSATATREVHDGTPRRHLPSFSGCQRHAVHGTPAKRFSRAARRRRCQQLRSARHHTTRHCPYMLPWSRWLCPLFCHPRLAAVRQRAHLHACTRLTLLPSRWTATTLGTQQHAQQSTASHCRRRSLPSLSTLNFRIDGTYSNRGICMRLTTARF